MLERRLYNIPEHWQDLVELLAPALVDPADAARGHGVLLWFFGNGLLSEIRRALVSRLALAERRMVHAALAVYAAVSIRPHAVRLDHADGVVGCGAHGMAVLGRADPARLGEPRRLFTIGRFGIKLFAEAVRQLVMMPFTMTGKMTTTYFQPGVPWIAFLMLVVWCLLEAMIFTYTLSPTVSEVVADLVGRDQPPQAAFPILFFFLFLLIMGSFACVQTLVDAVTRREFRFLVQMVLIELFVMFFEVMFLYRELVDAITPWIAQQTGVRMGIGACGGLLGYLRPYRLRMAIIFGALALTSAAEPGLPAGDRAAARTRCCASRIYSS